MITAQLVGGSRDGEVVTVAASFAPIPEVLYFPAWGMVKLLTDSGPLGEKAATALGRITTVSYRLRPKPRCCATWCVWPRPCTCCPRCAAPLLYDLVRP